MNIICNYPSNLTIMLLCSKLLNYCLPQKHYRLATPLSGCALSDVYFIIYHFIESIECKSAGIHRDWIHWTRNVKTNDLQFEIWAVTRQNQQCDCAPSEDSDQPGHPPSLIIVFAVRTKKALVFSYPLNAQRRLWSDWADTYAGWSESSLCAHSFCWFCREVAHIRSELWVEWLDYKNLKWLWGTDWKFYHDGNCSSSRCLLNVAEKLSQMTDFSLYYESFSSTRRHFTSSLLSPSIINQLFCRVK